jgi:hypothetical protein
MMPAGSSDMIARLGHLTHPRPSPRPEHLVLLMALVLALLVVSVERVHADVIGNWLLMGFVLNRAGDRAPQDYGRFGMFRIDDKLHNPV